MNFPADISYFPHNSSLCTSFLGVLTAPKHELFSHQGPPSGFLPPNTFFSFFFFIPALREVWKDVSPLLFRLQATQHKRQVLPRWFSAHQEQQKPTGRPTPPLPKARCSQLRRPQMGWGALFLPASPQMLPVCIRFPLLL